MKEYNILSSHFDQSPKEVKLWHLLLVLNITFLPCNVSQFSSQFVLITDCIESIPSNQEESFFCQSLTPFVTNLWTEQINLPFKLKKRTIKTPTKTSSSSDKKSTSLKSVVNAVILDLLLRI